MITSPLTIHELKQRADRLVSEGQILICESQRRLDEFIAVRQMARAIVGIPLPKRREPSRKE